MTRTRDSYHTQMVGMARKMFEGHVLAESDHEDPVMAKRWLIQRQREDGTFDSFYRTEVVLLAYGRIIAHGDITPVIFSRTSMGIRLGESDFDYAAGKAMLGNARYIDADVALADAREQFRLAGEDERNDVKAAKRWGLALQQLRNGDDVAWVTRALYEAGEDPENLNLGNVVDPSVYYAHAALARLCVLIPKEKTT